jgi:hypothetical protein
VVDHVDSCGLTEHHHSASQPRGLRNADDCALSLCGSEYIRKPEHLHTTEHVDTVNRRTVADKSNENGSQTARTQSVQSWKRCSMILECSSRLSSTSRGRSDTACLPVMLSLSPLLGKCLLLLAVSNSVSNSVTERAFM